MCCQICKSGVNDSRFLWKCSSCPKRFHAACIGVKREYEDVVREYMLPVCSECQPRTKVSIDLNLNELVQQLTLLSEKIKDQTEASHRSVLKLQNDSVIHEALDRFDGQLAAMKIELSSAAKNNSTSAIATAIKNHVSSLFDDTMHIVEQTVTKSLQKSLTEITLELVQIGRETQELTSSFENHTRQINRIEPNSDVLDELKALTSSFSALEAKLTTPSRSISPNLADELDCVNFNLFASKSGTTSKSATTSI